MVPMEMAIDDVAYWFSIHLSAKLRDQRDDCRWFRVGIDHQQIFGILEYRSVAVQDSRRLRDCRIYTIRDLLNFKQ